MLSDYKGAVFQDFFLSTESTFCLLEEDFQLNPHDNYVYVEDVAMKE